jgi:hypothetical protein
LTSPRQDKIPPLETVNLPARIFLYSHDQVAYMLDLTEPQLKRLMFYSGRQFGSAPVNRIATHNIAPREDPPIWRVSEPEIVRYLKKMGYRFHRSGSLLAK